MTYESFVAEIEEAILILDQIWENEPEAPGKGGSRMGYRFGQSTKKTENVSDKDRRTEELNRDMIERQFKEVGKTQLERAFFRLDHTGKVMSIWAFDPQELENKLADIWKSGDPTNADSLIEPSQNGTVGEYIFKQDGKGTLSLLWDMDDYTEVYSANKNRVKDAEDIADEISPSSNFDWGSPPERPVQIGDKGKEPGKGSKKDPVTDPISEPEDPESDPVGEEDPVEGEG